MSGHERMMKAIENERILKTAISNIQDYSRLLSCGGYEPEKEGALEHNIADLRKLLDEINQ